MKLISFFIVLIVINSSAFGSVRQKVASPITSLTIKMDSIKKNLDELEQRNKQLNIAVVTAEGIITKQNNFISGFEVMYGVISVLIVIISFLVYFFNIRPLIGDSKNAIAEVNKRIDYFDQYLETKLNSKIAGLEYKLKEERIDQIFFDLMGQWPIQRKSALERISSIPPADIASDRILQLFDFLTDPNTIEQEKIIIGEVLMQTNSQEVQRHFKGWCTVRSNEYQLKQELIKYYTQNGFTNFLFPTTYFITSSITPHLEFKTICGYLSSYGLAEIAQLINHQPLVTSLDDFNKIEICKFLNSFKVIWNLENEIDRCFLCKSVSLKTI